MRRRGREVVEVVDAPVVRGVPVARALPLRDEPVQSPRVVYVQVPAHERPEQRPVVVKQYGVHPAAAVIAGLAALLAGVGILVFSCNPRAFEPSQPLSGDRGQQVQQERNGR